MAKLKLKKSAKKKDILSSLREKISKLEDLVKELEEEDAEIDLFLLDLKKRIDK